MNVFDLILVSQLVLKFQFQLHLTSVTQSHTALGSERKGKFLSWDDSWRLCSSNNSVAVRSGAELAYMVCQFSMLRNTELHQYSVIKLCTHTCVSLCVSCEFLMMVRFSCAVVCHHFITKTSRICWFGGNSTPVYTTISSENPKLPLRLGCLFTQQWWLEPLKMLVFENTLTVWKWSHFNVSSQSENLGLSVCDKVKIWR